MHGFKWWDTLQAMESKVVARARFLIATFSVMGISEAHTIAVGLGLPEAEVWLLRIFTVSGLCSLLLRAGQKNNEPVAKPPGAP